MIKFAVSVGISPGIVVGQMQHRRMIGSQQLNFLKRRYGWDETLAAVDAGSGHRMGWTPRPSRFLPDLPVGLFRDRFLDSVIRTSQIHESYLSRYARRGQARR